MGATRRDRAPVPATDTQLAARLRLVTMRLARRLRRHAPGDISTAQLSALASLVRHDRLTAGELASVERVQPPTVTRIVDSLERQGLARRVPDPDDGRVTWVEPTPHGVARVEAVRRDRTAFLAERLRDLGAEERALVARALPVLERIVEEP